MPATKLSIETRADGSGIIVPTQMIRQGDTFTVYAIGRDDDGVFVGNVAADAWSIQDATGGVVSGDLVVSMDLMSAVFTAHDDGSAVIHANVVGYVTTPNADSGTITVFDHAIVTLDQAKEYLGVSSTSKDVLITNWIKRVTAIVETQIDQPVYPREATDIIDGTGSDTLYLRTGRIISIPGDDEAAQLGNIQVRNSSQDAFADLLTTMDVVFIDTVMKWAVILLDGNAWPAGQRNISITYMAGFASDSSDFQDLQDIALEFLQVMWDKSKQGGDLLAKQSKNLSEGGASFNLSLKDMSKEWQDRLNAYVRHPYL